MRKRWPMKMLALWVVLSAVLLPQTVWAEPIQFSYSSIKAGACQVRRETEYAYSERCSGFGGYDIDVSGSDHGSTLDVVRGGKLQVSGPALGGSYVRRHLVEWRYIGGAFPKVTALIFRMDELDSPRKTSRLHVLRLTGQACYLGSVASNEQARALADNPSAPCAEQGCRH